MPLKKAETVVRQAQKRRQTRNSFKTKSVEQQLTTVDTGVKRSIGEVTEVKSELDIVKPIKIPKRDHDEYCFICHKLGQELLCVSCPRSFHKKCLSSKVFDEKGDCFQCQQVKSAKEEFSKWPFSKLYKLMMDVIRFSFPINRSEKEVYMSWPSDKEVAYVADGDRMIDKCKDYDDNHYASPVEILGDAMWLYHNCVVTFGVCSINTKKAKKIVEDVQAELNELFGCLQCYQNKGDENKFTDICNPPHCIVWAKVKGFSYWPAKVLKVVDGHAQVKFFNTHQSSFRVKDVLCITKNYPVRKPKIGLILAKEELEEYVQKFESKYGSGSFPYQSDFLVFDFEKGKEEMLKIHEKVYKPFKDPEVLERRRKLREEYSCKTSNAFCIDLSGTSGTETHSENSHVDNSVTVNGRLLPGNIEESFPIVSETTSLDTPNIIVQNVRSVPEPSLSEIQSDVLLSDNSYQLDNDFTAHDDLPVSSQDTESSLANVYNNPYIWSNNDVVDLSGSEAERRKMHDNALALIAEADPNSRYLIHKGIDILKELLVQFWVQGASTEKSLSGILRSQRLLGVNAEVSFLIKENQRLSAQLADTKRNADYLFKYLKNNVYMAQVAKIRDLQDNICALTEKYNECLAQRKTKNQVEYKSTEAQTDIDYEAMNTMNGNYEEAINTAKFYAYCTVCFRPATITCCFNNSWHTDYCSELCQDKHREEHLSVCERVKKMEKTNCTHCSTQKTYENKTVSSTFEQKVVIEQVVSSFTPHLEKDVISEDPESNIFACSSQTVSIAAQNTVSEESDDITQK